MSVNFKSIFTVSMFSRRFLILVVAPICLLATACTPMRSSRGAIETTNNGPAITGEYCTTWTQWEPAADGTLPLNLVCLQPDGRWTPAAGFAGSQPATDFGYYGEPSLTKTAAGDILLGYARSKGNEGKSFVVYRYHTGTGWAQEALADVNYQGPTLLPAYSQFGGLAFDLRGVPRFLWTQSPDPIVSSASGNAWEHLKIVSSPDGTGVYRHPGALISTNADFAYIYYGEPTPTVWKFNGTSVVPVGSIPIDTAESTLYSSVTEWNGFPVIAFTSNDFKATQNWATVTDVTKVFVFNGASWSVLSAGIQDTPGHDGVNPFLFVIKNELHIMFADYTTDGLPTVSNQIGFRLRVKKWNGSIWVPVGQESNPVNLSQRFEFLNDEGTILVNLIQQTADGKGSEQIVLTWKEGQFQQLGNALRSFPGRKFAMSYRPGATIKGAGPSLR